MPPDIVAMESAISKFPADKYCSSSNRREAVVTIVITATGNLVGRISRSREKPAT